MSYVDLGLESAITIGLFRLFLFLGLAGVLKTELTKPLAELLLDNKLEILEID